MGGAVYLVTLIEFNPMVTVLGRGPLKDTTTKLVGRSIPPTRRTSLSAFTAQTSVSASSMALSASACCTLMVPRFGRCAPSFPLHGIPRTSGVGRSLLTSSSVGTTTVRSPDLWQKIFFGCTPSCCRDANNLFGLMLPNLSSFERGEKVTFNPLDALCMPWLLAKAGGGFPPVVSRPGGRA